jgi:hypothetical protein
MKRYTKGIIGRAVVVALIAGWAIAAECHAADTRPASLTECLKEADQADAAHDIEQARQVLTHAETLRGEATDAAEVQRRLAVIDWRYHHRFNEAQARLLRAAATGAEPAKAWLALARMEQSRECYSAAWAAASKALDVTVHESQRGDARLAWARAAVAEATALRHEGKVGLTGPLWEAFDEMFERVQREPGHLESSQLLLDRGEAALAAWHSYYRVAPGCSAPNAIAAAGEELERILPRFGRASLRRLRTGSIW